MDRHINMTWNLESSYFYRSTSPGGQPGFVPRFGRAPVAGNLLIGLATHNSSSAAHYPDPQWPFTETGGWHIGAVQQLPFFHCVLLWKIAEGNDAEVSVVQVGVTGGTTLNAWTAEFSGDIPASPLDQAAVANTTAVTALAAPAADTEPGNLIVGVSPFSAGTADTLSITQVLTGSGGTALTSTQSDNGASPPAAGQFFAWSWAVNDPVLGASPATVLTSGSTVAAIRAIGTFKAAAAQPGTGSGIWVWSPPS